jgi:hypothetical protein
MYVWVNIFTRWSYFRPGVPRRLIRVRAHPGPHLAMLLRRICPWPNPSEMHTTYDPTTCCVGSTCGGVTVPGWGTKSKEVVKLLGVQLTMRNRIKGCVLMLRVYTSNNSTSHCELSPEELVYFDLVPRHGHCNGWRTLPHQMPYISLAPQHVKRRHGLVSTNAYGPQGFGKPPSGNEPFVRHR